MMKEFTFKISQPASGIYRGEITIKAKNEKAAKKMIREMTQQELDEIATDWELGDEVEADGDIEVYDKKGWIINE